jgi:2-keto-3-deoxy-L-rhamnonate aldolase RhmA
VPKRVSPCERLHAQIDEVFAGGADLAVALERVAQLGAQLLLQAAIEARWRRYWAANATNAALRASTPERECATGTARPRLRPPPGR